MPRRHLRMTGPADTSLGAALRGLRTELDLPDGFPPDVLAEADRAAGDPAVRAHEDATDLPFLTIDPPGSTDLDQAMHLERRRHGYRVHYAIADVAAFVRPGGALDAEGAVVTTSVRRALVRSRARLDYAGVQRQIDTGTAEESLALLRDVGRLRQEQETARGGISLDVPEQEIVERHGTYGLAYRAPLPTEAWNAQISLLTGMAAAHLMAETGTGILRTLPVAPDGAVARLRRSAEALRIDWPHHVPYARLVRSLDPRRGDHAAFLQECTTLLRGAGYTVFEHGELPVPAVHAAVADLYTHCTAPLRRLVDRYAAELCLAADADRNPPEWVLSALPGLPKEMAGGTARANTVERECVDLVEAALLKDRVGEVFDGYVVDVKDQEPTVGTVHVVDPAVVARIDGGDTKLPLGERLRVRLDRADPGSAKALFVPA